MMQGHFRRLKINVRRDLCASIHRVDDANTRMWRASVVRHRVYSVDHPNSVWHVDGNHELISQNLFHPCPALLNQLATVNIMLRCLDNGQGFYMGAIQIVGQHLQSGCVDCSS